jgi:hypothetical protein
MADTQASPARRTPLHLWVVGVITLLWNAMGCFDYLMTETRNEAYLKQFTPEQIAYFTSFPAWTVAFWALAVWGGLAGSILLLLRKRFAYPVFAVSFVSMLVTSVYSYGFSNGLEAMGGVGTLIFSAVIFVVALFLVLYARAMVKRGVLA